ncbi:MAG: phosphate signaling complex protein PhoU [Candidatus Methanoliparum thermophilum]|uniref:Phosphate-specific transport system accessory protein PhoU n=1 Tax=Methanoliparum thermophilum TaxID=2491083 RepID=A0A520KT72_METT2|nr:phosphate signaling complex protein PhoU [Candidatus Methanoliparum sp. LAM-1]RZN65084.1 MAG: phosphate signaling complex protein PhoU [Candidatus Methanoliparum thermophilum]BDC36023.1 phosphate transport system regulatory protein PhoU [Candidatus Methanoliparum sp. LAM-1]
MTRERYKKEISLLKDEVYKMGLLAKELIEASTKSFITKDIELAKSVLDKAKNSNKLELNIENKCIQIIALQQPVAKDLRIISTCMKVITDFNRLIHLAGNIAETTVAIGDEPFIKPLIDIPRMIDIGKDMLDKALSAFKNEDLSDYKIMKNQADLAYGLYEQVRRELLTFIIEDPKKLKNASDLLIIARFLKRIVAHAYNIFNRTIYMVTGNIILDHEDASKLMRDIL